MEQSVTNGAIRIAVTAALLPAVAFWAAAVGKTARSVDTTPSGARLTISLDDQHPHHGAELRVAIELRNVGTGALPLAGADRCNPTVQLIIWNKEGGVAWAPGLPLCQQRNENTPPTILAPGASRAATECLAFSAPTGRGCSPLDLPSGVYQVGGSFYGFVLPRLELTLGR